VGFDTSTLSSFAFAFAFALPGYDRFVALVDNLCCALATYTHCHFWLFYALFYSFPFLHWLLLGILVCHEKVLRASQVIPIYTLYMLFNCKAS
jgi:hypothetical protein